MDKSSIEQKIKDRLKDHGEHIDNDALFSSLGIDEKPSKKRFIWIPFVLLAMTISGVYFFGNFNSNTIANNDAAERQSNQALSSEHIKERASKNKIASSELKVKESISEGKGLINSQSSADENSGLANDSKNQKLVDELPLLNKSNSSTSKSLLAIQKESINTPPIVPDSSNEEQKSENENKGIYASINEADKPLNPRVNMTLASIADIADNNSNDETNAEVVKERNSIEDVNLQHSLSYLPVVGVNLAINGKATSIDDVIYEFQEEVQDSKWYIMPFISYDRYNTRYRVKLDQPNEDEIFGRGNELEHVSAGILGTYMLNEKWYGSFGLEYSQYSSKFNFSEYFYSIKSDTGTISRIDYIGKITEVVGTEIIETETERKWTIYNRLRMIQIPVSIGYNVSRERYSLFTEVGMNIGIYSQFSGVQYDENFEIVRDPSFYKKRPNLSMEIGFGGIYHLSEKSGLFGKVRFRQSLTSISSLSNPLEETMSQAGLVIGYRYKL